MSDEDDIIYQPWESDQLGALIRDKCRALILAIEASDLDDLGTTFEDPVTGDDFRVVFTDGEFFLQNLDSEAEEVYGIDLFRLGVIR